MNPPLFPFDQYWGFYAVFTAFVLFLLLLDLGLFHRKAHKVSMREAAGWSVFWVSLGLAFGYGLYRYALWSFPQDPSLAGLDHGSLAQQTMLEYFTGFVIEKALAVDNLFVFVMVFAYLAIPPEYQHRVLFFGILGALIFRAIFIALGSVLLQYEIIVLIFGVLLIITGIKILVVPKKPLDSGENTLLRLLTKWLPVTPGFHGQSFFVRNGGKLMVTPLFVALVFIEISDIIFAVDSVPAIFAITKEPLIVFTSNVFAILGMRAMFFLLAGLVEKFHLLHYALGVILVFVGLKMVWLNNAFGGKFPITWSLGIIIGLLAASVIGSLLIAKREDAAPRES
ncbi:MAG TPA: TerC/Alx family metal homeostasis membrane protein [Terrimicrobiaceae bacterium]|nr:TerC/Alx family metal homeostasis membrane protein [Terrimicrobiaceae bacterium]